MPLTPHEKARLREIEAQLSADDEKLARLLRSRSGEGLAVLRKLRTWQLAALVTLGVLVGPVGLSLGMWWPGIAGYVVAAAAGVPLLGRLSERYRDRREQVLADRFLP